MDFLFLSMPYSKFDSRWFANVPNINLGILEALLLDKGYTTKAYHFHLAFETFLQQYDPKVMENFITLSEKLGVEFLGLDYVFASLLFEKDYFESRSRFRDRLEVLGLDLEVFDKLRNVAKRFVHSVFSQIAPMLKDLKLVGFSCSHYQLSGSLLLCKKIKEVNPAIRTVFGGKDCSGTFAKELISHMDIVDFVGIGECEVTIVQLLKHLEDNSQPLVNVIYRNESVAPQKAPLKKNLSMASLPFPSYDFRDIPVPLEDVILPLELGRGCPWQKCTFCPDKSYNISCQTKTVDQIKKEISYYTDATDALRNFIILDSDALKDPDLIVELASFLTKEKLSFHFGEFRAEWMNRKVLSALSRFGSWISPFQVGIETFSDRLLQLMNKGVSAIKNVEVLKGAVELGVKLQFNLFTCYPNMSRDHMDENLKIIDKITHLLVHSNIEAYPGEFYLPTDCHVFLNIDSYELEKNEESIFADVFENFPLPSYSNYPYPYEFENHEEQFEMATALREKVQLIKEKSPRENYLHYEASDDEIRIVKCFEGVKEEFVIGDVGKELYMSAIEETKAVGEVTKELGTTSSEAAIHLQDFERKGLILFSSNRDAFLSLATAKL